MFTGAFQYSPAFGDRQSNMSKISGLLASSEMPDSEKILVFPELCLSGYRFEGFDEALELSESKYGPSYDYFSGIARQYDAHIVFGYPERQADEIFISQSLVAPSGEILADYRKVNLFRDENLYFTPGNLYKGTYLNDTHIALGICMDLNVEGYIDFLAQGNFDLVCISNNWLYEPNCSNKMYWLDRLFGVDGIVIISNISGSQRDLSFSGSSMILNNGNIVAESGQNFEGLIGFYRPYLTTANQNHLIA